MYYEVQLYGCVFECPLQSRGKECPFNEVDHLSIKEKIIWGRSLSGKNGEIDHLISV